MTVVYNNNYDDYVMSNKHDVSLNGCFVCFEDTGKNYGVCRHCLLGVCRQSECVDIFPHTNDSEYLICYDCKKTIEKKLQPVEYTDEDLYKEEMEKKHREKILRQAEAEKTGYENALTYIKMLHVVQ